MNTWLNEEMNKISSDNNIQPISNSEASFLMFDAYKKKLEVQGISNNANKNIDPIFNDFLKYFELFPQTKNNLDTNLNKENENKDKKSKLQEIRAIFSEFTSLYEIERVLLWNLMPQSVEECIILIPSLARFLQEGNDSLLDEIIEKIKEITEDTY